MTTIRIESTRENQVTFPEVNKGPEAKEKGLKYFTATPIIPGEYTEEGKMVAPGITPIDSAYLEALKGNHMVESFFAPGGGMRVLEASSANGGTGLPDSLHGLSDDSAKSFIGACDDAGILIGWLRDSIGGVRDAALAKLQVVEAKAKAGTPSRGKKEQHTNSAA